MLPGKRGGVSLLALLVVCSFGVMAAAADENDGPAAKTDGFAREVDNQLVLGGSRRSVGVGAQEGESSNGCTWSIYVSDDFSQPIFQNGVELTDSSSPINVADPSYGQARLFSETGRWFQAVGCDELDLAGIYAEGESRSIPEMLQEAEDNLDPPEPGGFGTSPPDDGADRFPVVHIPTWFWVEEPYRSTIWTERIEFPVGAPRVWVEASAEPDYSEWEPGDGEPMITCPALGEIYDSGDAEDATDCTHTYTQSSAAQPGTAFGVQGTVWFATSWDTNVPGQPVGPLAPIFRQSPVVPVRVGEIQAVGR